MSTTAGLTLPLDRLATDDEGSMAGQENMVFGLIGSAIVLWLVFRYYWLRVGTSLLLLAIWGAFVVVAPLWIAFAAMSEGHVGWPIVILLLAVILGFFWWTAAQAAYEWYRREERFSTFWKPWNAR